MKRFQCYWKKNSNLLMELNDKNILISKLEKKVETYPSQVTKLP